MDQNSRPVVDNIRRASVLLHPHTAQEQTSPSRVRPATPCAEGTNKGASSKVPSGPSSTTSGGPLFFARVPPQQRNGHPRRPTARDIGRRKRAVQRPPLNRRSSGAVCK